MALKAFIIDDEAPARRELKYLLKKVEGIEIVGEAPNGTLGLKGIRETQPHIVFMDIQMPGISGLELTHFLREVPEKPLVIFATAFEGYALEAFEAEAFDYVLKPFSLERIKRSVAKAAKFLTEARPAHCAPEVLKKEELEKAPCDVQKRIPLYKGDRIIPTPPEKILFAQCLEGEIAVVTQEGKFKTKSTLQELESKLISCGFIRTHRRFLVNAGHVLEIIPWFNGSYKLVMSDKEKTEVLVSRHMVKDLKQYFNI
ncbi:MAG: LytTR family DNA-binding domain-containing protein [Nitrospirota bacterium]